MYEEILQMSSRCVRYKGKDTAPSHLDRRVDKNP